ncbi:MAG: shikimate kinase [Desulforhopalus sp.]
MARPNIILTGFMGCGKTTVGKLLANKLDYRFIDTDQEIEHRTGMSIPEIFSTWGEDRFRTLEHEISLELAGRREHVISTGGRLMLDPDNVAALSSSGDIFCLAASAEDILKRVSRDGDKGKRPLLNSPDPLDRINTLIREREEGYKKFTQISTSDRTPQQVTALVLRCYLLSLQQDKPKGDSYLI